MWLSRQGNVREEGRVPAQVGETTDSGRTVSVCTEGEERELEVYAPGGYRWKPEVGEQVLVLKAGAYGEEHCVAGAKCEGQWLQPGEVQITSGACSILLRNDGVIQMSGLVLVNGRPVLTEEG